MRRRVIFLNEQSTKSKIKKWKMVIDTTYIKWSEENRTKGQYTQSLNLALLFMRDKEI